MRGATIALALLIPGGCAASRPVLRAAPEAELASAEQVAELHLSPALIGLWFDAAAVWSGAGSFASEELGRVGVETLDERLDRSRCGYEPLAGTTILRAGGHTAVIRYDGAQDCDREGTATWTLDGEAMGELSGINCAVVDDARGRTGTAGWPWLLALMLGLGSLRARARAR